MTFGHVTLFVPPLASHDAKDVINGTTAFIGQDN